MFGNPNYPGRMALKIFTVGRIDVRRAPAKQGDNFIGNAVRAKIVKNKVARLSKLRN